jgi:hypothetical protein
MESDTISKNMASQKNQMNRENFTARVQLLIFVLAFICASAMNKVTAQVIASGECGAEGDNLTWTLTSDYTLTIIGNGAMKDYNEYYILPAPWYSYRQQINTLVLGDNVSTIGSYAFHGCNNLKGGLTISNTVTKIGQQAFRYCHGLTSVTIGNNVTEIGAAAFGACLNLKTLTIGNSVKEIGQGAFLSCKELESVTIPNSVITINGSAFRECSKLTSLIIGNSLESIGEWAFYDCNSLSSVILPNSATAISRYAFARCSGLVSITIPNSVTIIGHDAFWETPWYNNLPNGLVYINNVLYKYKGTMPSGTAVNIREGTISISQYAFSSCTNLISVTIPNTVTTIGNQAFWGCSGLSEITCYALNPPRVFSETFSAVPKSIPVSVPCISETAYKQTDGWKDFTNYTNCINTTGLNDIMETANLILYPNPATTEIHIKSARREIADYAIVNVAGQIIMQGKLQRNSTINIESLPHGIYYLKIIGNDKTMKFVKN